MDVTETAQEISTGQPMGWIAKVGLVARALVYLIMGWLALTLAFGDRSTHVDQRGVLTEILDRPLGTALVVAAAIGFAAYALWRLSEVFVGPSGEPDGFLPRATSLVRAIAYAVLSVTAVSVLMQPGETQAGQQQHIAQSLMTSVAGRILVGLAGAALVGVGAYQVHQGLTIAFMRFFPSLPPQRRAWVVWLGRIGTVARGIVFALAGSLAVVAAWRVDPQQAGGIDDAVRLLIDLPFGSLLASAIGMGLIVFGLYGLAEAAWRRVPDEEPGS